MSVNETELVKGLPELEFQHHRHRHTQVEIVRSGVRWAESLWAGFIVSGPLGDMVKPKRRRLTWASCVVRRRRSQPL